MILLRVICLRRHLLTRHLPYGRHWLTRHLPYGRHWPPASMTNDARSANDPARTTDKFVCF